MKIQYLNKLKKNNGFSLVEIILSLLIMSILAVTLVPLFKNNVEIYLHTAAIAESGQSARIAFNRLLMDMRMMTTLNSGSASSINFDDVNGSNLIYTLSGTNLLLNGSVAAEKVSGLTIQYVDINGASSSSPSADTWQLRVTLQFDIYGSPQTYSAEIQPRNWQGDI